MADLNKTLPASLVNYIHQPGNYDSEFELDSETERKRKNYEDLTKKIEKKKPQKGHKRELEEEYNKEEGRIMRQKIISLNAFDKHKMLINNYILYYGGSKKDFQRDTSRDKTDMDIIRENHRFLWSDDDDPNGTWAKRLAKKYYDKLFKEYCISDLSRYKENKIAMRWRIEKEVLEGKGQFVCGNKKCEEIEGLRSWEVNFGYMEGGQKKNALVKLRLCPDCSYKLNYYHRKKEVRPVLMNKKQDNSKKARKHEQSDASKDTDDAHINANEELVQKDNKEENPSMSNEVDNVWSGPAKVVDEKSREEEFDDYLSEMFL